MDRRTILAVVLALTTFLLWDSWMNYRYPDRYGSTTDSAVVTDDVQAEVGASPASAEPRTPAAATPAAATPVPAPAASAPEPAPAPEPVGRLVPFQGCDIDAKIEMNGGFLRSAVLTDQTAAYNVQPLYKWLWARVRGADPGPWKPWGEPPGHETLLTDHARVLGMGSGEWTSPSAPVSVNRQADGTVVLTGTTADGIEVTRSLRAVPGGTCTFQVTTTWRNTGATPYDGKLWLQLHDVVPPNPGRYDNAVQPYTLVNGKYEYVHLSKLEEPKTFEGPVGWMAIADRYFALVLLPEGDHSGQIAFTRILRDGGEDAFGLYYTVDTPLAAGAAHTEKFELYMGPKDTKVLKSMDPKLGKLVYLGLFSFFGKILLILLQFFHSLVDQWGVAIILLTVAVKGLFFPLTQTSFKSSQAMSALQPELQAIREQYKDKPEELNRRTMELFKERGVNPLGGCLPMLVQFPVWISLYQVLLNSVELYHTKFLYLRDLSSVDPYGALPAVVVVLMLVQQQFMPTGNMDPTQARMMKLMPLLFGFFFFAFPSGLVIYIFVNMVLTIIQQWVIRRTFQQPTVAAVST